MTASAPIPRSVRPVSSAPPVKIDTVVSKGVQPVPPATLAQVGVKPRPIDPWTRAMMLAPNFHYAMLATVFGDQDMTLMRSMFVKPDVAVRGDVRRRSDPGPELHGLLGLGDRDAADGVVPHPDRGAAAVSRCPSFPVCSSVSAPLPADALS